MQSQPVNNYSAAVIERIQCEFTKAFSLLPVDRVITSDEFSEALSVACVGVGKLLSDSSDAQDAHKKFSNAERLEIPYQVARIASVTLKNNRDVLSIADLNNLDVLREEALSSLGCADFGSEPTRIPRTPDLVALDMRNVTYLALVSNDKSTYEILGSVIRLLPASDRAFPLMAAQEAWNIISEWKDAGQSRNVWVEKTLYDNFGSGLPEYQPPTEKDFALAIPPTGIASPDEYSDSLVGQGVWKVKPPLQAQQPPTIR